MAKLVCLMRLGWLAGVAGAVGCGSDSEEPAPDDATVTNGTTSTATGDSATGSTGSAESAGVVVDGTCKLLCADASTDADASGATDGWGFEAGQSCVVPGGMADTGEGCSEPVLATGPDSASTPGTGVLINGTCTLVCADGRIHAWGGGGLVADSDCDTEYRECLTKVEPLLNVLAGGAARQPLRDRARSRGRRLP